MSDESKSGEMIVPVAMSFSGSAQRIWKITHANNPLLEVLLILVALTLIVGAWIVVAIWYFIMYVLFGVFFILWRFLRHGSRKRKSDKLRHGREME